RAALRMTIFVLRHPREAAPRRKAFFNRVFPQPAVAVAVSLGLLAGMLPAQQSSEAAYTLKARTELVLVNVAARDRKGNLVRDLTADDFTVLEDGKQQKVSSFDIENTDVIPASASGPEQTTVLTAPKPRVEGQPAEVQPTETVLKDRRLLILFFDLSAMQPDEIGRSVTAAQKYVDQQMAAADLVSVVSLGSSLRVEQDFTSDRGLLKQALNRLNPASGAGFEEGSTGTTEGTPDTGQPFTADETEYNIFNTDRRLEALRSIAASVARIEQKKSLIYFSSGMNRTGIENQSQLRAAINAAVRSNLAIYTMDIRGLQTLVPGGEAQQASLRGTAAYSGRATLNAMNSNFASQETLATLAGDTGGRAFLDTNDFGQVFKRVQEDTAAYYVLGYHSSNPARDGKFRRIVLQVRRPGLKLEYRRGYYAPADFQHSSREDRERQLEEELASELPTTDLPVYLATGYFRLSDNKFFVPISLVVPGSEIPFTRGGDQDKATLDVIGAVTDDNKRPITSLRDTVQYKVPDAQEVRRKNVQYNSGFVLPTGKYHLKLVVRENQSGRLGSFETDLVVPELKGVPLKMSSVMLASQLQPAAKRRNESPLVREGSELIPNVTHVFSSGQHLYIYYEVYDPARQPGDKVAEKQQGIRLLSNVAFYSGKIKTYETSLVEAQQLNVPERKAAVFQLDVPLAQLKPGFYTCQVNVIDDAAGRFAFPRLALLVRQ
ncbi:MAG TPA: VWA domain-containing protein, partial [Terriglobales bacterium]|nr:VWA domain-containing protein [Terriglobales bacterium]